MKNNIIATISTNIEKDLFLANHGMPGLIIHTNINGKNRNHYLYPFRNYKFQVCRSIEGECDEGSSDVIGLGNVYNATMRSVRSGWGWQSNLKWGSYEVTSEILSGLISKAILHFQKSFINNIKYEYDNGDEEIKPEDISVVFKYKRNTVDMFAMICTAYIAISMGDLEVANQIHNDWCMTDVMKEAVQEMIDTIAK